MDQMDKNTVEAKNQLKESEVIAFENLEKDGVRVMFVGNSITLHGVKEDIGWMNRWGMAASAKEKDYVHLCMKDIMKKHSDAAFCICQASGWEMRYKNGEETYPIYESARNFEADIIVMRLVENCPKAEYEKELFMKEYAKLIAFLNPTGKAKVITTTGFWKHPADEAIRECANANGYTVCELSDLGEQDVMKALGLFEHSGVANHPGDLGMQAIAERICKKIDEVTKYV